MKFSWCTLKVKNLEDSIKFYQEIIGLKLNERLEIGEETKIAFLGNGETQIELIEEKEKINIDIGKDISLGFEVESLDEIIEFLKNRNIKIEKGPFQPNPYTRFLFVEDPNGAVVQLIEKQMQKR